MFSMFKPKPPKGAAPEGEPSDQPAAVVPEAPAAPPEDNPAKPSWGERLKAGLSKTRFQLNSLFTGIKVDEALFEDLEAALISADCGVPAAQTLIGQLRERAKRDKIEDGETLRRALAELITDMLRPLERAMKLDRAKPLVVMISGVNGVGKTTSIGKLAKYFQSRGKSVLLAAGDTFRAAAREQLVTWGERNNIAVITQESGDAAAVIFDATQAAKARGIDILMADTAGRLPTQLNLMEEIKKVKRVITKADATAPHEVLLVIDANTGQNAVAQVKAFDDALTLTGLVVTKLDGTAKGGVLCAIAAARPRPVYFIGVGEGIEDLRPFKAHEFANAMLGLD
ncbi:MAG TPA: signal recognition particle-docking protein FtsY [Burkholderiales bacterium]|jgi:fused signal recognition particle receptor|nr:signal recognition particle-docking protein FtsY [Burkholderiales bacterium]